MGDLRLGKPALNSERLPPDIITYKYGTKIVNLLYYKNTYDGFRSTKISFYTGTVQY